MTYSRYRRIPVLPDPSTLPFPGKLIRSCSDCNLRAGCTAPVPSTGLIPSRILLVGEAPGQQEDLYGYPFAGNAGDQLNSMLHQNGIVREEIHIANIVNCRPPGNRTPKPAEIQACAKWLNIILSIVNPDIVVAMGATAITWFLGQGCGTVEHLHGRPLEQTVAGRKRILLPSYHPAAALYNSSLLRQLNDDFVVLGGLARNRPISDFNAVDEYPNPEYKVMEDTNEAKNHLAELIVGSGQVAIDTETIKGNTKLWSLQISTSPGSGWFVPVHPNFNQIIDTTIWKSQIIVHHYLSDSKWLKIPEDNFWDSMISAYLLGLPQGLKELAARLCGMKMITYSEMVRPGQRKLSTDYLTQAVTQDWGEPPDISETKWDNFFGNIDDHSRFVVWTAYPLPYFPSTCSA